MTDDKMPKPVFSRGPWLLEETGQRFTGDQLDAAAFAKYRAALDAQAEAHAMQYLGVTDAMGYKAGGQCLSPEEFAANLAAERAELRAQVEALRADAERYRWLRGGPDVPPESNRWARWEVRHWCGRWWNTMFAEALDAAIDAARSGGGK